VIALPEDVQDDEADVADAARYRPRRPSPRRRRRPRARAARGRRAAADRRRRRRLERAGGRDVLAFAEASNVPVAASFRRQDYVDNGSPLRGPLTIGMDPALAQRVQDADVVLALGTRLGEIATQQYSLLEPPRRASG
jgi:acetolactate synthase-1/2/3 large subunit